MFPQFAQVYACEYFTIWPRCLATAIIEGDDFYWDHIISNENYHSPPTTTKSKAKSYVLRKSNHRIVTSIFWLSKFRQVSHLFIFNAPLSLAEVLWCKPKSGTPRSQRSKVQEQSPWIFSHWANESKKSRIFFSQMGWFFRFCIMQMIFFRECFHNRVFWASICSSKSWYGTQQYHLDINSSLSDKEK